MHDGRFASLEEVVAHYVVGVRRSPDGSILQTSRMHPEDGLPSVPTIGALVAILRTA
jgi:cytochrome c peroxidase